MSTIIPANGRTTFILSAERDGLNSRDNANRMALLLIDIGRLDDRHPEYQLRIQPCHGAYKGTPECSVAVTGPRDFGLSSMLRQLAHKYSQESILLITPEAHGILAFIDEHGDATNAEAIGHYQACSAHTCDAWTSVDATGETFTFI